MMAPGPEKRASFQRMAVVVVRVDLVKRECVKFVRRSLVDFLGPADWALSTTSTTAPAPSFSEDLRSFFSLSEISIGFVFGDGARSGSLIGDSNAIVGAGSKSGVLGCALDGPVRMREESVESMPVLLDLDFFSRRKTTPSNRNLEAEKNEVLRGTYLGRRSLSSGGQGQLLQGAATRIKL